MALADILQIYEFLKTFAKTLNIRSRFSVKQLQNSFEANGDLSQQIIVALIDKIIVHFMIDQQCQGPNVFIIIASMKLYPRRSMISQIYTYLLDQLIKIPKLRPYLKDHEYFERIQSKDALNNLDLVLFLIELCYECEFITQEMQRRQDIQDLLQTQDWKEKLPIKLEERRAMASNKKALKQAKFQQQLLSVEQEIDLLNEASEIKNDLFLGKAFEQFSDQYVFLEERAAIYTLDKVFEGPDLKVDIKDKKIQQLKQQGYFQQQKEFEPVIVDKSYQIEQILEDQMNLDYFSNIQSTRDILLSIENDYSEYELGYWGSNWASEAKRMTWKTSVIEADEESLWTIIGKIPHQLSFVNKKHGALSQDETFKSSRLYWFYSQKAYASAYQSLSKQKPTQEIMYLLTLSLYEKLKTYIGKKMRQIDQEDVQSTQSSKDINNDNDNSFQ